MLEGKPLPDLNKPKNHKCTVNAWTSVFPETQKTMIYVQFGVQERRPAGQFSDPTVWPTPTLEEARSPKLAEMRGWFALPNGPRHLDCGVFIDEAGARNWIFFAYWLDEAAYAAWNKHEKIARTWTAPRVGENEGIWREQAVILTDQMETIQQAYREHASMRFFSPVLTETHEYWGAARDRIPASATNTFESEIGNAFPEPRLQNTLGRYVKVELPGNICHVRSAQDLMMANREHLATYTNVVEPSLREGLSYIGANPVDLGAFVTRYIRETTLSGEPLQKTCGQLYFLSLAHMEKWAASHHTHLKILYQFNHMAVKYGSDMGLALWHEVAILPKGHLQAEYINCHGGTGFLPYFAERQTVQPIERG